MKEVLINVPFRDVYTGEVYTAGKTYPMTEERVKEIKEVNPNFITVVGNAKEKKSGAKSGTSEKKSAKKNAKATGVENGDTEGTDGDDADDTEAVDGEDADGEDADGE